MINVTMTMISYHDFYIHLFVARCLVRLRKQYEALADPLVVDISKKCPHPLKITSNLCECPPRILRQSKKRLSDPFKPLARESKNISLSIERHFSFS